MVISTGDFPNEVEFTPLQMPVFKNANIAVRGNEKRKSGGEAGVMPLNIRHKEVLELAENGMNDTEIAKKLNMGKGEVQLILGMTKN